MKKYILFLYEKHEGLGGLHDLHNSYDTFMEAVEQAKEHGALWSYQIVDRDTWEIVREEY